MMLEMEKLESALLRGGEVEMSASRARILSSTHSLEYQPRYTENFESLAQEPVASASCRYHKSAIFRGGG